MGLEGSSGTEGIFMSKDFSLTEYMAAAVLLTAWLIWGFSFLGNYLTHVDDPAGAAMRAAAKAGGGGTAKKKVVVVVDFKTLMASANAEKGANEY